MRASAPLRFLLVCVLAGWGLMLPGAARAGGPVDRPVDRAGMARALAALDASARVKGLAWAVLGRQVVVTADGTVGAGALARVRELVAGSDGAVRLERVGGELRTLIAGGEAVYGLGPRCTLGANVHSGSTFFFITAGHCTQLAGTWYADPGGATMLGPTSGSSFPGNDYGVVRYANPAVAHPSSVSLHPGSRQLLSAGNATVGLAVCMSGSVSGVRCGTVQALNTTVVFAQGVVSGLIRTNICAEPGDSGAPLFAGMVLIGILSGGSGNCTTGGTTFFQPVTEILAAFGLTLP